MWPGISWALASKSRHRTRFFLPTRQLTIILLGTLRGTIRGLGRFGRMLTDPAPCPAVFGASSSAQALCESSDSLYYGRDAALCSATGLIAARHCISTLPEANNLSCASEIVPTMFFNSGRFCGPPKGRCNLPCKRKTHVKCGHQHLGHSYASQHLLNIV